jgi:hypothetical protein
MNGPTATGPTAGLAVDARELARVAEPAERGLDRVDLVERRARVLDVPRVRVVERHLEAARHRRAVDLDPLAALGRPAAQDLEQPAPRRGPRPAHRAKRHPAVTRASGSARA